MSTTYAQKSSTVQKAADTKAASILDSSAQSESLQRKADMANCIVQRKKNGDQMARKARRVFHAKQNIKVVYGCTFASENHVFLGEEDNSGRLTGFHAYDDGKLPDGVKLAPGYTSKNVVHDIEWYKTDESQKKRSTMFPLDMPKNHVKTLIALKWPSQFGLEEGDLRFPEETREYIKHGRTFDVRKSGDADPTFYPERE